MKYRMYLPEGVLKGFKKSHEKVSIKWISPDEFLKETSVYEHLRPYEGERKLKLKEKLSNKVPLDPLWISYDKKGELWGCQGRHRALASKEMGIKKIPVLYLKMKY